MTNTDYKAIAENAENILSTAQKELYWLKGLGEYDLSGIEAMRDAITELLAENERIVAESKQCHEQNDRLVSEHIKLRAALERVKEAAWHHRECPMWESGARCDCGLNEVLN